MAGFKFEVGIKKGIRKIKEPLAMTARTNLIQDWAQAIQKEARRRAALPAPGTIYGKGRNTGALVESIQIEESTSKSGNTVYRRIYVDEARTKTQHTPGVGKTPITTSYARFQEYGTGIWSSDPGSPKALIIAKNKQYMTWIQHGKAYRGNYIHAYSVAEFETKPLSRKRLVGIKKGRKKVYQTTFNRRAAGGPWKQIATLVTGVRPKHYMSETFRFAENTVKKDYAKARDEVKRGIARTIFFEY